MLERMKVMKKVFLICPVRNASEEAKEKMQNYIKSLENENAKVYYPHRDTNQNDPIGYNICSENREGLLSSDEVHIWYDKKSEGSVFDLGMAWASGKKLVIVNPEGVKKTETKSIANLILEWSVNNP